MTGKLPPLTAEGQKRTNALAVFLQQGIRGPLDSAQTRPVRERCIWWESEGPPLAPMGAYNANLQLVQNQDYVVILIDADTLRYEYTVDDPTTWTRPWTGQQFLTRIGTPLYEYACHEGNHGIVGILSGARAAEQAADGVDRGPR